MTSVRIVQTPEIELRLSVEDGFSVLGGDISSIEEQLRVALNAAAEQRGGIENLMPSLKCRFPGCNRAFTTLHGRGTHEARAHKGWKPTEEERILEDVNH